MHYHPSSVCLYVQCIHSCPTAGMVWHSVLYHKHVIFKQLYCTLVSLLLPRRHFYQLFFSCQPPILHLHFPLVLSSTITGSDYVHAFFLHYGTMLFILCIITSMQCYIPSINENGKPHFV